MEWVNELPKTTNYGRSYTETWFTPSDARELARHPGVKALIRKNITLAEYAMLRKTITRHSADLVVAQRGTGKKNEQGKPLYDAYAWWSPADAAARMLESEKRAAMKAANKAKREKANS